MTTRVHIINFGPDPIKIFTGNSRVGLDKTLYPHEYTTEYVYEGQDIDISEQKKTEV